MSRPLRLTTAFGVLIAVAAGAYLSGWGRPSLRAEARPTVSASLPHASGADLETATLAAGCFWCIESDFDSMPGVVATTSGYTGGRVADPTYEQVSAGGTGHVESVQILFDPKILSFEQLLDYYWHNVDPF